MVSTETSTAYDASSVPPAIARYFLAQGDGTPRHDILDAFTSDAHVTDEGVDYYGTEDVRSWLTRTSSEYSYTSTLTGQRWDGADEWSIIAHLEGDFPGGVVDLTYRFTLRDDRIARLHIAP